MTTAIPTQLSLSRLTAPLPAPAAEALHRLERAFLSLPLVRAVTRYEVATARYDELVALDARTMTGAQFDSFAAAQQTIAESLATLAAAGRLDLIAPAETATRYRQAASHCRRLSAHADYDGCLDVLDEMAMCLCQLERAGRLDLVERA